MLELDSIFILLCNRQTGLSTGERYGRVTIQLPCYVSVVPSQLLLSPCMRSLLVGRRYKLVRPGFHMTVPPACVSWS